MGDDRYQLLMKVAILLSLGWLGWSLYDWGIGSTDPESLKMAAGLRYLEDGDYQDALTTFEEVYRLSPDNLGALRGKAQALMHIATAEILEGLQQHSESQLRSTEWERKAQQRYREALACYNAHPDRY